MQRDAKKDSILQNQNFLFSNFAFNLYWADPLPVRDRLQEKEAIQRGPASAPATWVLAWVFLFHVTIVRSFLTAECLFVLSQWTFPCQRLLKYLNDCALLNALWLSQLVELPSRILISSNFTKMGISLRRRWIKIHSYHQRANAIFRMFEDFSKCFRIVEQIFQDFSGFNWFVWIEVNLFNLTYRCTSNFVKFDEFGWFWGFSGSFRMFDDFWWVLL